MLVIKSVEDFDSLLSLPNEKIVKNLINLNYTSYAETIYEDSLSVIGDEFLSAALNKDLCIQIGSYIYKIDKPNEKLYALHIDKLEYYSDLRSENTSNKFVLEFSTEENVFELLNEYKDEVGEKSLSKNCQSSSQNNNGGWSQYADFTDVKNVYGNGTNKRYKFNVWLRVRYDNWGIFRKLFTEFKHKEAWGGTYDGSDVAIAYQFQYYQKKSSALNNSTHYPSYPSPNYTGNSGYEFFTNNKEIIHYRATKCLGAYVLKSWCWFRDRQTLTPRLYPANGCLRISGGLNTYPC